MKKIRRFAHKLKVIWNEDILYSIWDWCFWKFKYPRVYKNKRCLKCGALLDSDYYNDEGHCDHILI